MQRAREINQLYGPKGSAQAFDFLFELHNTTANVGACLIASVQDNLLPMHLCHFIQVGPAFPGPPYPLLPGQAKTPSPNSCCL